MHRNNEGSVGQHLPTVTVFGLGYVGLTLSVVLAESGFQVVGVEPRKKDIASLKKGKPHIHERDLPRLLKKHINRRFFIFNRPEAARSGVYIVCVGTPIHEATKIPGLEYIEAVAKSIGQLVKPGNLIILRSTVPVGTTRDFFIPIVEKVSRLRAGKDFSVVFAPERTVEGDAIREIRTIPQVIGGFDSKSCQKAKRFFRKLTNKVVIVSSLEAAEIVKLLNNTYRDVIFGFANETALICNGFNIDPHEVIHAANEGYARSRIPNPSPGVGGYCLTKDPYILLHSTKPIKVRPHLAFYARRVNAAMYQLVAQKLKHFVAEISKKPLARVKISILGFAFKGEPETSDMRYSTTLDLLRYLKRYPWRLVGHDPVIEGDKIRALGIEAAASLKVAFDGADGVVIMTNHASYRDPRLLRLLPLMKKPALFFDPWQLHSKKIILRKPNVYYSNLGFDSY